MKTRFHLLLGSLVVIAVTHTAHAATLTWDITGGNGTSIDAGSGIWNTTAGNLVWNNAGSNVVWSQTSATSATNSAVFGGADGTYAITVGTAVAAGSLGFLNSGYTFSASSAQQIYLTASPATVAGSISIAAGKSATIGSNVTIAQQNALVGGGGTLNISGVGAKLDSNGGANLNIVGGSTVNVMTGGTFNSNNATVIGRAEGNGSLLVNGGAVTVGSVMVLGNTAAGSADGRLTLTSGTVTVSSTTGSAGLRFGSNTAGTFNNSGTVDLNGGTLTVAEIYEGTGGTTTSTFNLNGGTLKVLTGTTFGSTFMTGLDSANVKEGGAFIDTNNNATTIGQALIHGGSLTTDGGLTKNGAGILTLTGNNSYTGATTINTGTLTVGTGGSLGANSAALNVNNTNSGAGNAVVLNLATTVDTVTGSLTGTIATPSSGSNTVTINTGGSGRSFTVNQTAVGTYAGLISGAGSFTLGSASTNALTLTGANTYSGGTTVSGGRLIASQNTPGGTTPAPYAASIAGGATLEYAIASSATQGATNYTGAGTIQKTGAGTITLGTTVSSIAMSAGGLIDVQAGTFKAGDGTQNTVFTSNLGDINLASSAAFDGYSAVVRADKLTGTGIYQAGYYGPRSLTVGVNNGSSTFAGTLQGNGVGGAVGSSPLVKTGTGTLTLTGTVNINNTGGGDAAAGDDVLRVTGGTSGSFSTLTLSPTGTSVMGSVAAKNTVSIAPSGSDYAVFNQTAGTVNTTAVAIAGAGVGTYNLSGGTVNTNKVDMGINGASSPVASAFLNVSGSSALNIYSNGTMTLGTFYGHTETINQTGGTVALYSDAGTTLGGTGSLAFSGGSNNSAYTLSGGTLAIPAITLRASGGGAGGGSGTINLNGGTLKITNSAFTVPTVAGKTVAFNVQGDGAIANSGANIDTSGLAIAFNAPLAHSGPNAIDGGLAKTGAGTLTLSATSTYTGPTTVTNGVLAVNGSLANSTTTVATTAKLQGSGSIAGAVTIQSGGTLAAGNSIESLATGALTLAGGSTFAYEINNDALAGVAGDLTAVTGALTLDVANTALLTLSELGAGSWTADKKLTLISYSGSWNGGLFNRGGTLSNNSTFNFSGMDWLFKYDDTSAGTNYTGDLTGSHFVTMTVVPEPSVLVLAALGSLGLATRRRRRA